MSPKIPHLKTWTYIQQVEIDFQESVMYVIGEVEPHILKGKLAFWPVSEQFAVYLTKTAVAECR